jgi:colanic acid/amylovoran biosynthesis glycosyltransferase
MAMEPVRTAILVNSFPAISEKFILNQIVSLAEQNVDFDIYASVAAEEPRRHALFGARNLEHRIINMRIPRKAWKRLLHFPLLFITNFARNPLFTLRALSVKKYSSAALNLKNLYFLKYFYGKEYAVIHCHFGQNGLTGAFLKDCGMGKRLIVTFHGTDITVVPGKFGANMYRHMFKTADVITAGSNFVKNRLALHGCDADKIQILPMGIITKKKPDTDYFLSVGRLIEVKGFSYSIEAFALLARDFDHINYYIAGNGPLHESLNRRIIELGMETRIFLLGEKTDIELEALFDHALAFIIPSIRASDGAEEGQGLVIQEAESWALPVIGADTGGISDGIISGRTGWIVPEKEINALREKMAFLVTHPDTRREFGEEGRKFALAHYDNAVLSQKLIHDAYHIF